MTTQLLEEDEDEDTREQVETLKDYDERIVGSAAKTLLSVVALLESKHAAGLPPEQKADIAAAALERFRFACVIQSLNLVADTTFPDRSQLPDITEDELFATLTAHSIHAIEAYNREGNRLKNLVTLIPGMDWRDVERSAMELLTKTGKLHS